MGVVCYLHNVVQDVPIACALQVEVVVVEHVDGCGLVGGGGHGDVEVHAISRDAVHYLGIDSAGVPAHQTDTEATRPGRFT